MLQVEHLNFARQSSAKDIRQGDRAFIGLPASFAVYL